MSLPSSHRDPNRGWGYANRAISGHSHASLSKKKKGLGSDEALIQGGLFFPERGDLRFGIRELFPGVAELLPQHGHLGAGM